MRKILSTDFECLENAAIQPLAAGGSGEETQKTRVLRKRWVVRGGTKQRTKSTCVMYVAAQIYNNMPLGLRRSAHYGMPEMDDNGNPVKDENGIIKSAGIPSAANGLTEFQAYYMYEEFRKRRKGDSPEEAAKKRLAKSEFDEGFDPQETKEFISWLTKNAVQGNVEEDIKQGDEGKRSYLSYDWREVQGVDDNGQITWNPHCFLVYGYEQNEDGTTKGYLSWDPERERNVYLEYGEEHKKISLEEYCAYPEQEDVGGSNRYAADPWADFWSNFDDENWHDPWAYDFRGSYYSGGYNSEYNTSYYGGYPEGYWLYYYVYA